MIYPESFPCHVLEYDEVMLWLLIVVLVHKIKWLGFLAGGLPVHFLSAGRRYWTSSVEYWCLSIATPCLCCSQPLWTLQCNELLRDWERYETFACILFTYFLLTFYMCDVLNCCWLDLMCCCAADAWQRRLGAISCLVLAPLGLMMKMSGKARRTRREPEPGFGSTRLG